MKKPIPQKAVIRLPLNYIAFWQSMTFLLLICAVWACEMFGLLYDGQPDIERAALLTTVIVLGAIIVVAHSYLQERKALHGLITICSYCRRVRIDENAWTQIEQFVIEHSSADFTHGVCPGCYQKLTSELADKADSPQNNGPLP